MNLTNTEPKQQENLKECEFSFAVKNCKVAIESNILSEMTIMTNYNSNNYVFCNTACAILARGQKCQNRIKICCAGTLWCSLEWIKRECTKNLLSASANWRSFSRSKSSNYSEMYFLDSKPNFQRYQRNIQSFCSRVASRIEEHLAISFEKTKNKNC